MPEPRTETLSFRLTASERQIIDTQARRLGLENSEFARRVLLDVAMRSAEALDDARREARAEVREELGALQDALDTATEAAAACRSKAEELEGVELELSAARTRVASLRESVSLLQSQSEALREKLHRAPEELAVAVRQLIAGAPDGRAQVARVWARIRHDSPYDREEAQPIIAAEVVDAIESIVARFPTDGEALARWPSVRRRIEWLFEGLRLDAGRGSLRGAGGLDAVWKPVVEALDQADAERRRYAPDVVES
jgi:DNA repair exonuclease SbcCD ATPase subunit